MKLFEYAILHRTKARTDRDGNEIPEKLVILQPVKTTVAKDERTLLLAAAKEIPEEYTTQLDQVEIAVRPF